VDFIAEVVGPAAIGVEIVEMLVQVFWKQPAGYVEIFVVMRGEPASVLLGRLRRTAPRRDVLRDLEFAWAQHQKERFLTSFGMTAKSNVQIIRGK
jgi:hypothetical protein